MGGKAALDFQSLMRSVVASIAVDLAKLAVVAPISNAIFGAQRPTLMGTLSGGPTATGAQQAASPAAPGGIIQTFGLNGLSSFGLGGGGGAFSGLGNVLGLSGAGGLLSTPLWTTSAGSMATTALPAGMSHASWRISKSVNPRRMRWRWVAG
jgi:hypothetical protein